VFNPANVRGGKEEKKGGRELVAEGEGKASKEKSNDKCDARGRERRGKGLLKKKKKKKGHHYVFSNGKKEKGRILLSSGEERR